MTRCTTLEFRRLHGAFQDAVALRAELLTPRSLSCYVPVERTTAEAILHRASSSGRLRIDLGSRSARPIDDRCRELARDDRRHVHGRGPPRWLAPVPSLPPHRPSWRHQDAGRVLVRDARRRRGCTTARSMPSSTVTSLLCSRADGRNLELRRRDGSVRTRPRRLLARARKRAPRGDRRLAVVHLRHVIGVKPRGASIRRRSARRARRTSAIEPTAKRGEQS